MNAFVHLTIILSISTVISFKCAHTSNKTDASSSGYVQANVHVDTLSFTSGVRSILQDRQGHYWFGSHSEGVAVFDGTSYKYLTTDDGLSNMQVRSIYEDKEGKIWFGTGHGVSMYDGEKVHNLTPSADHSDQDGWPKTVGDLWFNAGSANGVYRYDGRRVSYLSFPPLTMVNPDNAYHMTCFAKDSDSRIWFGTYAGVIGFDGQEFLVLNDHTLGLYLQNDHVHVRSILADSKGRLWIGNNGIGVLLREGDNTINFSDKYNLIHPMSRRSGSKSPLGTLEHVFAIAEDSNGHIWFGDRDTGAWRYDDKSMENFTISDQLASKMIWTIYQDQSNHLLFGMADGGVYQFNGVSFDRRF